jgi:16S rRNA (guanine527-N7)-methyltransferase
MPRASPPSSTPEIAQPLERAGIRLEPAAVARLAAFVALLMRWNEVYNLTGLRVAADIVDRHLIESLALRPLLRGERIADVGTGAGLPGVPLAIAEPSRSFTLIESRAKRVRFLRHAIGELGLGNATVAHGRAEHLRPDRPFATVLARAVAPPAELLEICRTLTAPGSILLLLTAAHLQSELRAPDFVPRPVDPERGAPRLRSSIVILERTDAEAPT